MISAVTCEGSCPALLRISPLQNYDLTIENVEYESILVSDDVQLGQSLVGMSLSGNEDVYTPGQEQLQFDMKLKTRRIGTENVDSTNWQSDKLG